MLIDTFTEFVNAAPLGVMRGGVTHVPVPNTESCDAPPTYTFPFATVGTVNLIAEPASSRSEPDSSRFCSAR